MTHENDKAERDARLRTLLEMIASTRDEEIACDDCLAELARFVEHELEGGSAPATLDAVRAHLEFCGECREEHETLRAALEAME